MILRKLASFHFFAMAAVCVLQVAEVVGQDNCNCVCSEKSLKKKTVCQHLSTFIEEKKIRRHLITELADIKARMVLQEDEIRILKSQSVSSRARGVNVEPVDGSDTSNMIGQPIMHDLNETWHGIKNLENKLQNVTSFVHGLHVDGMVYPGQTQRLNERLDSMEQKLSKLTNSEPDSNMSKAVGKLQKALESINETVHLIIRIEDSHEILLKKHSNKLNDLKIIEAQVKLLSNGLRELQKKIQAVKEETKLIGQELYDKMIQSFEKEGEKTKDQLEKFKAEWISSLHGSNQNPFAPRLSNFSPMPHTMTQINHRFHESRFESGSSI